VAIADLALSHIECLFRLIHPNFSPSMSKLRPLGDRVIVKPAAKEEMTKAGIILPDTVDKERPEQGEIIAVGPGRTLDNGQVAALSLKIGDKVVFKKYGPDEVTIGDEEFLVISESDVMAVIE
jgi:chaperonin GroES